ncbi:MAG: hypothetical protein L0219_21560 [Phycisphaerales bacterium]|nr:hypothetical protein [Phycisphaerales bacterium]
MPISSRVPWLLLAAITSTILTASACNTTRHVHRTDVALNQLVAQRVLADHDLDDVLSRARHLLKNGFNAGSGYPEVWIRDFATFMDISCQVNDPAAIRSALLTLARFQRDDGNIPDGIGAHKAAADKAAGESATLPGVLTTQITLAREIIDNSAVPDFRGFKNSVETDQETSLVQAIHAYVRSTHDTSILAETVDGQTLLDRLERGLDFLLQHRFSQKHGLIYGATTIDWGDIAPEDPIGAVFNEKSHRAIDVYDNAMFLIAIDNFLSFVPHDSVKIHKWRGVEDLIRANVRKHLWDATRQKFIPHLYLDGSPFPAAPGFDENDIWYHGGTAVAIQAGLLTRDEIASTLQSIRLNVRQARGLTLGVTNYPLYPKGLFQNPNVDPGIYQNGGDWDWFGARFVQALVANGFGADAYLEILPIVYRVQRHDGFFEWFDMQDKPQGSSTFRGSAGVIAKAILDLQLWAKDQLDRTEARHPR